MSRRCTPVSRPSPSRCLSSLRSVSLARTSLHARTSLARSRPVSLRRPRSSHRPGTVRAHRRLLCQCRTSGSRNGGASEAPAVPSDARRFSLYRRTSTFEIITCSRLSSLLFSFVQIIFSTSDSFFVAFSQRSRSKINRLRAGNPSRTPKL